MGSGVKSQHEPEHDWMGATLRGARRYFHENAAYLFDEHYTEGITHYARRTTARFLDSFYDITGSAVNSPVVRIVADEHMKNVEADYDPGIHTIRVARSAMARPRTRFILAHEAVHAFREKVHETASHTPSGTVSFFKVVEEGIASGIAAAFGRGYAFRSPRQLIGELDDYNRDNALKMSKKLYDSISADRDGRELSRFMIENVGSTWGMPLYRAGSGLFALQLIGRGCVEETVNFALMASNWEITESTYRMVKRDFSGSQTIGSLLNAETRTF